MSTIALRANRLSRATRAWKRDSAIWCHSRIALLLESTQTVEDTILTMTLLFAQFFGASSDSLEHSFQ
jgi:hypothetical protein